MTDATKLIENLPQRVFHPETGSAGTLVEAPKVERRQYHPNLHVLFVPDEGPDSQFYSKAEARYAFRSEGDWPPKQ